MSREFEAIEKGAMQLSADEREQLASRLFSSLSDDCLDPAWEKEIARRIQRIENGTDLGVSEKDFFSSFD